MTYELADELKDAGFPLAWHLRSDALLPYPTLSQLIEACGVSFVSLDRTDKGWRANGFIECFELTEGFVLGEGSTPEEAVARLWLALRKEKNRRRMNREPLVQDLIEFTGLPIKTVQFWPSEVGTQRGVIIDYTKNGIRIRAIWQEEKGNLILRQYGKDEITKGN